MKHLKRLFWGLVILAVIGVVSAVLAGAFALVVFLIVLALPFAFPWIIYILLALVILYFVYDLGRTVADV